MFNSDRSYSFFTIGFLFLAFVCGFLACCSYITYKSPEVGKPAKEHETHGKFKKLALLVGINEYQHVKDLKGAVNDVKNIKALLVESFGFPDDDEHILILTDERATRQDIIKGIEEHLIAKADSDSIVLFHYSGHGSQMRDAPEGDEPDRYDETIVPHDSGRRSDGHPNQDITDDELNALLHKLTDKAPNVTLILDSCHSGSAIRGAGLARTVERDDRPPPQRERKFTTGARGVIEGKSGLRPKNSRYALISGSAANQVSYELWMNGQSHGALTWYLTDEIRQARPNATYRDIMDLVKARVTARYPMQHPQLEGPGEDQLVFSDKSLTPTPYVLATAAGGDAVTLAAGQVQGVTEGSIYEVYPPGTKSFDADIEPVAQIKVSDVDITNSTARIVKGKVTERASRAVEREHHCPDAVLRIHFKDADQSQTLQKIKTGLSEFEHITAVETASGYDLLLREHKDEKDGKRYIITEGGDPTEISPRVAVSDPDAVSRVVKQVTHWAKWFNIMRINHQQPNLGVAFELRVAEVVRESALRFADREVNLTLAAGEQFTMEVTNKSQQNLYIALLDLSSDGSVDVVYPLLGQQEFVAPNKTWRKPLETWLPEGRDFVRDLLKLIATTNYADFGFLKQGPVPRGSPLPPTRGRPRNPLEELLANAAMGTTRGVKQVEVENWTTVDRVLEVRRRE